MGMKLPPDQLALYQGIDEILWKDWDPIGVAALGGPQDEYQAYLPQVFQLARQDAPASKIAEYLHDVVEKRIGLSSSVAAQLPIAEKVRALKLALLPEKQ